MLRFSSFSLVYFCLILLALLNVVKCEQFCGEEFKVPVEGFKRKNCIPGHYDGSCLLIFSEKVTFREAYSICHFDYGGRLATADSEVVFKKWMKRIYRDFEFKVDKETRFWVGYGKDSFYEVRPKESIQPNKAFEGRNLKIDLPWEDNAIITSLETDPCSSYATVFNPNNGKLNVESAKNKHSFLCETPRYPKFKCPSGWHLTPENRMCVWFDPNYERYLAAYHKCRSYEAFLAIALDEAEFIKINAICDLHSKGLPTDKIWSGLKFAEHKAESLDGTENEVNGAFADDQCIAYYGRLTYLPDPNLDPIGFDITHCGLQLPYMCQKFVDQAFNLNAE